MRCDEARERLGEPEAEHHIQGCADCRAYVAQTKALDALLARDTDDALRPGFNQRFFARLAEVKAQRPWWRRIYVWLPAAAATAAVALALAWPRPDFAPDEIELAMDLDMLESFDVARSLDDVEAFEALDGLKPGDLKALLDAEAKP